MKSLYSCSYFPNIAWLSSALSQDEIHIEKFENYVRQSYRSRCYILGANGIIPLIVPVKSSRKKILIKNIEIENNEPWQTQHLRSIMSAYGKSPFYEHYFPFIEDFYNQNHRGLFDLCLNSLTLCLKMLNVSRDILTTESYQDSKKLIINDLRNEFSAKDLGEIPGFFRPQEYFQLFGKQFASNLSTLDLIFCEGPGAFAVLQSSFEQNRNE